MNHEKCKMDREPQNSVFSSLPPGTKMDREPRPAGSKMDREAPAESWKKIRDRI